MNRGRAVILNPSQPSSIKRREFLIDSLRSSGLDYTEITEETRLVLIWEGDPNRNMHGR